MNINCTCFTINPAVLYPELRCYFAHHLIVARPVNATLIPLIAFLRFMEYDFSYSRLQTACVPVGPGAVVQVIIARLGKQLIVAFPAEQLVVGTLGSGLES